LLFNTTSSGRTVTVTLPAGTKPAETLWPGGCVLGPLENTFRALIHERDALILSINGDGKNSQIVFYTAEEC
jgi:hypothetical protein